jgi:hypothetical protein
MTGICLSGYKTSELHKKGAFPLRTDWSTQAGEIFVEVQNKIQDNPDLKNTPAYKAYEAKASQVTKAIRKGKCNQSMIDQLRTTANNV